MTPDEGAGDFAQAMMDLGATICTPRSPRLRPLPARRLLRRLSRGRRRSLSGQGAQGGAAAAARASPTGSSMTARCCWCGGRRAACSAACSALPDASRPAEAEWGEAGAVEHVFTHFALTMTPEMRRDRRRGPRAYGGRSSGSGKPACRPCSPSSPRAALAWREKEEAARDVRVRRSRPEGSPCVSDPAVPRLAPGLARSGAADAPMPAGTVELAYGDDPRQRLDFTPARASATRRWSSSSMAAAGRSATRGSPRHMAAHFHGRGYAFAALNYRLVPEATPPSRPRTSPPRSPGWSRSRGSA